MPGVALSAEEREEIRVGIDRGDTLTEVALSLGRPTSTVSREVKRNGGRSSYCAVRAHGRAAKKRARPRETMFESDPELSGRVAEQLANKDSPMTIAIAENISHETIYQGVYANGRRGLAAGLGRYLHRHRRHRKARPRGGVGAKKASPLGQFRGIALRPVAALEREEVGHLEGDLIIGKAGASAVVTLIDRATSLGMLGSLQHGYTADQVVLRIEQLLRRLPPGARRTVTWDQGREMAHWAQLEELSGVSVYFADPHAPWQRPVNENFNGLVRRWLPKGTDLSIYTQDDLEAITMQINSIPRRSLGWDCAYKHHYDALVALTG